jgi:hypothetical protein
MLPDVAELVTALDLTITNATSTWSARMNKLFQIGSKRGLAKRNAGTVCTVSVPRQWSMRKIWDSSKFDASVAFKLRADSLISKQIIQGGHELPRAQVTGSAKNNENGRI